LYLSDFTATGADIPIGAITTANRNPVSVTDIAITPDGKAYVLSFTNLYSLNTATATVTPIGSGTLSTINALASDSAGNLWGASVADGSLYRIDRNSGSTSLAGRFGANWVSSGDLAFDSDGTLWAAVHRTTDTSDTLATVNTATGAATPRGTFMPYGIFGLIFANNTLYGLSYSTNSLYVVNTTSGMATFVRTLSFSPYGTSRKR
jgi:ligand-binding sensor domain-containing protein